MNLDNSKSETNSKPNYLEALLTVLAIGLAGAGATLAFRAEHPAHAAPAAPTATPAELVGALHAAFGVHHARAVHAKGIILEGDFTPDPAAATLTKAAHLQSQSSKLTARFSDFTGIPNLPDTAGVANPRGFAVRFTLPNGASSDIVGHSFNGFPTPNPTQFRELLLAISKSGASAPKPTALDRFLETHPVAQKFLSTQKTPASFATIGYFGVNAFKLTNAAGVAHYVRYQFVPEEGEQLMTPEALAKAGSSYLFDEVKQRVAKHSIKFRMLAQIAAPTDRVDDPSQAWPDTRQTVVLGTLELKRLGANSAEQDRDLAFSPNNIPDGIETADPMLDFRSKAYPISVAERR